MGMHGKFGSPDALPPASQEALLAQIEALLEGHAYGGPKSMVSTALGMMETNPVAKAWLEQLNSGACLVAAELEEHHRVSDPEGLRLTRVEGNRGGVVARRLLPLLAPLRSSCTTPPCRRI